MAEEGVAPLRGFYVSEDSISCIEKSIYPILQL